MSNHITIELCEEDRKRLDGLFLMAAELVNELKAGRAPVVANFSEPEINHPADILPPHGEPEPIANPEPAEKVYKITKDDIMAKVQALAAPNSPYREQAKAIVKSYGAKVSDIPEDKYTEVMAKLAELEG